MKQLFTLALLLGLGMSAIGQDDRRRFAETITAEDLRKHLTILASDEYEGRETGKKGQKMAAEYIRNHFAGIDLSGPVQTSSNPYYQPFDLVSSRYEHGVLTAKGKARKMGEHFFPYGTNAANFKESSTVFLGYGLEQANYNDYADQDIKGKVVVFFKGEPRKADGTYLLSGSNTPNPNASDVNKLRLARERGAALAIILYENDSLFQVALRRYKNYFGGPVLDFEQAESGTRMPILYASHETGALALNTSASKLKKALDKIKKTGKSPAGAFKGTISADIAVDRQKVGTENVLGFMEGTDKKDEILVVTSHYDHIGITNGQINNGADDDGSGTVGVLEIAEAFAQAKKEGKGPRRSILFMTVTGEEKGLLGSEYYSENPVFPLKQTITNLNIDMIGRVDPAHERNPDYIYIIGSDMLSSDLHKLSERVQAQYAPEVALDYTYNAKDDPNRFYYRSDHYNFAKHNIPVIFYFNGTHADYHRPTDDVEKINFEKMTKVARLIFHTAWELANAEQRPVVDKSGD